MSFTSRWPDVYVAAGARAVSTCGDLLAATALALALQQSGAGGTAVSALLLAATVPMVFLAPLTGRMVDRVDSRRLLIIAGIVQAAVCLGLAYTHDTVAIIALVGVLGCGLAITQPTLAALLPAMVRRADLAKASSINQTAVTLGSLTAPALAGVLVGGFGTRLPLLLDAVSYLSLVVAGLLLRTRRGVVRTAPAPVAWRLRGDRLLTGMVVAVAAVVAGVGAINVVEVFFVRDTLHASTTVFGLISASWAAGALLGAVVAGRVARGLGDAGRLVTGVLVCLAAACAAIMAGAAAWTALQLIPLWLIGGAFNGVLNVLTNLAIVQRVPEAARGRAFASYASAAQGFGMAGLLGGGLLVDHFDPRMLVAAAGIAGLVAVAACTPTVRVAIRASRRPAPEASSPEAGGLAGEGSGIGGSAGGGEKGQAPVTGEMLRVGDSVG
jgi:MFS family permease